MKNTKWFNPNILEIYMKPRKIKGGDDMLPLNSVYVVMVKFYHNTRKEYNAFTTTYTTDLYTRHQAQSNAYDIFKSVFKSNPTEVTFTSMQTTMISI